jgi:hypothetical protein
MISRARAHARARKEVSVRGCAFSCVVPLASRRVSDNRALSLIGLCILTWIKERE